jgi:hypothetical protein
MMAPKVKNIRNETVLHPCPSAHHRERAAITNRPMAIDQANSWGRRRRSQRSRVLRPNAKAMMAEAAARAVFKVTLVKARRGRTDFVNVCTKE